MGEGSVATLLGMSMHLQAMFTPAKLFFMGKKVAFELKLGLFVVTMTLSIDERGLRERGLGI